MLKLIAEETVQNLALGLIRKTARETLKRLVDDGLVILSVGRDKPGRESSRCLNELGRV